MRVCVCLSECLVICHGSKIMCFCPFVDENGVYVYDDLCKFDCENLFVRVVYGCACVNVCKRVDLDGLSFLVN